MSITESDSPAQHVQAIPRKVLRDSCFKNGSPSEHVFQADLNDAAATAAEDSARICVGQTAVPSVGDGSGGSAQVEMIEGIQEIGAKLHAVFFGNREVFLHADIPVPRSGTVNAVPLRITPLPGLRRRESPRIEPLHAVNHIVRSGLLPGVN